MALLAGIAGALGCGRVGYDVVVLPGTHDANVATSDAPTSASDGSRDLPSLIEAAPQPDAAAAALDSAAISVDNALATVDVALTATDTAPPPVDMAPPPPPIDMAPPAVDAPTIDLASDSSGGDTNLAVGLVGHWRFDEGSGTLAADSSGAGNHGTLVGSTLPGWTTNRAPVGSGNSHALAFQGGTAPWRAIAVPDSTTLDIRTRLTVTAWIRPDSLAARSGIVHKGQSDTFADEAYSMQFDGAGHLAFSINGSTEVAGNTVLTIGAWQHVAVSWDGSTAIFYVAGAPDGSAAYPGMAKKSAGGLHIGKQTASVYPFTGLIDDVRVYDRVLTASEVTMVTQGLQ